jgi:hypothetical protein
MSNFNAYLAAIHYIPSEKLDEARNAITGEALGHRFPYLWYIIIGSYLYLFFLFFLPALLGEDNDKQ